MHKLLLLAAVALLSTVHQASADCNGGCAIQQPSDEPITKQEPKDSGCVLPTPPALNLADCAGGCVVDEPITSEPFTPPTTQERKDCSGTNCVTSKPAPLKLADCGSGGC
jgi:hypothetical protein